MKEEEREPIREYIQKWIKLSVQAEAPNTVAKLKVREEEVRNLRERIKALEASFPHPCDGELYKGWDTDDFFQKATEEFAEMCIAYRDWKRAYKAGDIEGICQEHFHLMEESTHAQIAITSFMESMGTNKVSRAKHMRDANASNAKRDGGRRFKHD